MANFLIEKKEYLMAKLKTPEGRFDIFLGSFIIGFVIVNYTRLIFAFLESFFVFLKYNFLIKYVSYLIYGLLWIPLGYGISWLNIKLFKYLKLFKRKLFGGK